MYHILSFPFLPFPSLSFPFLSFSSIPQYNKKKLLLWVYTVFKNLLLCSATAWHEKCVLCLQHSQLKTGCSLSGASLANFLSRWSVAKVKVSWFVRISAFAKKCFVIFCSHLSTAITFTSRKKTIIQCLLTFAWWTSLLKRSRKTGTTTTRTAHDDFKKDREIVMMISTVDPLLMYCVF